MDNQIRRKAIESTVGTVFPQMFFMFPVIACAGDMTENSRYNGPCYASYVAIRGNEEIVVECLGSEKLVVGMAENFIGVQGTIGEAELLDVFRETANVVAGNLVHAFGMGSEADLQVPSVVKLKRCPEAGAAGITFDVDGEFFKVCVTQTNRKQGETNGCKVN